MKTTEEVVHSRYIECFNHVDVLNALNSNSTNDLDCINRPGKPEHVTFRCHPNYISIHMRIEVGLIGQLFHGSLVDLEKCQGQSGG